MVADDQESTNLTLPNVLVTKSKVKERSVKPPQLTLSQSLSRLFRRSNSNVQSTFADLPQISSSLPLLSNATWLTILGYLDAKSLVTVGMVCHGLHLISSSSQLWKDLCWKEKVNMSPDITLLWNESQGDKNRWWKLVYIHGRAKKTSWLTRHHSKSLIPIVDSDDSITCFKFDADYFLIGSKKHRLILFETSAIIHNRTEPKLELIGHSNTITAIKFSSSGGNIIASGDSAGTLIVWNLFTGKLMAIRSTCHLGGITTIEILDSEHIITSGFDSLAKMFWFLPALKPQLGAMKAIKNKFTKSSNTFSPRTLVPEKEFQGHSGDIYALILVLDKRYLVTGASDHLVKVWNSQNALCIHTLKGHRDTVTCLENKGEIVISGSLDKTIMIWNIRLGVHLHTLQGHADGIKTLFMSSKFLASGGWDQIILIWDLDTFQLEQKIRLDIGPIATINGTHTRMIALCREPGFQHQLTIIKFH